MSRGLGDVYKRLDWVMPTLIGEIDLFSVVLIQMLISSRKTETPTNNLLPAIWATRSVVKSAHKITHACSYLTQRKHLE